MAGMAMRNVLMAFCLRCSINTPHEHLHDCAHGIPETHMAGSERFVCTVCKHSTYAGEANAAEFKFILDKTQ
jgi:hypothetical protein